MMVLYVMGLFISVLFCGLSLDIGMLELQRAQMQTAADAAAIAEEMHFERQTNIDNSDGSDGFATAPDVTRQVRRTCRPAAPGARCAVMTSCSSPQMSFQDYRRGIGTHSRLSITPGSLALTTERSRSVE